LLLLKQLIKRLHWNHLWLPLPSCQWTLLQQQQIQWQQFWQHPQLLWVYQQTALC
jgi:hypothetical protein